MLKYLLFISSFTFLANESFASIDSIKRNRDNWIITPRLNTLNMAPVSGNIINRNINIDLSIVYTQGSFMWTVVNAFDLEDAHSEMNYFLSNVRYKIKLTNKISLSPFLAFYSEHAHQLFDPISDANGGAILSFQNKALTIETFLLFVRLTHKTSEKDIINRFEIKYKVQSLSISGFVYSNLSYFDNRKRTAIGFRIQLPEVKLLNKINTRTEITGSFGVHENPETNNLNGVFLSLAFPVKFPKSIN